MPLSPPSPGFPAMDSPCLQLALGTAGCSKACWAAGQLGFTVQSFALPAALSLDPGHAVVSVGKPLSLTLDLKCKINPISSLISTCFGTEILGVDTLSCSWHRVGLGSCTQICTELPGVPESCDLSSWEGSHCSSQGWSVPRALSW